VLAETSQAVHKDLAQNECAFWLIQNNAEALRWRLALIDSAQSSIDLQTFIWSNDEAGRLVASRLILAAHRGVRIRLLVDDLIKEWGDENVALMARIPNIELRHFNPGRIRKGMLQRALQMSLQFKKLNRRMHNKQMIVDGHWVIIGGRNIGNSYFGLATKYNNRDLDLLLTGAIVPKMGDYFDVYWNAKATYPGEALSESLSEKKQKALQKKFDEKLKKDREFFSRMFIPFDPIDWRFRFRGLVSRRKTKGTAKILQDSPDVEGDRGARLLDQIVQKGLVVNQQLCMISPYLIPTESLFSFIKETTAKGCDVSILVPALDSNNHTMAHSHYQKYREKLMDVGVQLYEFSGEPSEAIRKESDTDPIRADFISLHTKAFVLDRDKVFLGSLNLDPRSININTEHLLFIHSPALAEEMLAMFNTLSSPENAWKIKRNKEGDIIWVSDKEERTSQPSLGLWQRWSCFFWRWVPIENQL
jgi:putative cardiolipin synthase